LQLATVRFWGKITGTTRDYLIAECTYSNPADHQSGERATAAAHCTAHADPALVSAAAAPAKEVKPGQTEPVEMEAVGTGLNAFVYYVVGYQFAADGVFGHYTYDKWIKLPAVKPEHVTAARQIKKLFSGNLEASVDSYPPFPGNEAEYLTAQVNRIARGATMTIAGLWSVAENEENPEGPKIIKQKTVDGEDPFEVVKSGPEGLSNPEGWKASWVHHPQYPNILSKMGRCVWPVKPLAEDEEPAEDEEKEEPEELNKSLEEEAGVGALDPAAVRLATAALGDFSPAVLSSTRWLGAHAIALETKCVNVYCGNGVKYTGSQPFQVVMPPALPAECSESMAGEEGAEPEARSGMVEQVDEPMPDPFLVVDQAAEGGEGEEDA